MYFMLRLLGLANRLARFDVLNNTCTTYVSLTDSIFHLHNTLNSCNFVYLLVINVYRQNIVYLM